MIDYIFYGLYVLLFLYSILYDFTISRTFTIKTSNFTALRKGDILMASGANGYAKVKKIKKQQDYIEITVKPTKKPKP